MMWNFLVGGLLVGATVVLFDGSPGHPDLDALWALAERHGVARVRHVGALRAGVPEGGPARRATQHDLSGVRALGSTGSPLSPEQFAGSPRRSATHVQICSMSGGTDVCTAFLGQRADGAGVAGRAVVRGAGRRRRRRRREGRRHPAQRRPVDVGELVITQPMPSMPVAFWDDPDGSRLREAYFDDFPGRWRHGDWVRATPRGSYVISGRSDSTLNRGGVRMGTADFYAVVEGFDEVVDSLVVDTSALGSTRGGRAAVLPRAGRRGGAGRRRARAADGAAHGAVAAARPGPVRGGRRGARGR